MRKRPARWETNCYNWPVIHDIIIRYGESIWPGTSPRQTPPNRIYIGNLESDLLAGEGWVANRPSCRSKWSEGEEACQCFLLYILTCIKLINPQGLYLHQMELESGYDFPEVVMTTEGVWDDVTFTPNLSLAFLSLYNAILVVEFN